MDYFKKKQMGLIKDEDENATIDIYEHAPGLSPTKVKRDDLVTFTSSKKEKSEQSKEISEQS